MENYIKAAKEAENQAAENRPELINLEKFTSVLNLTPAANKVKSRQGIQYLPISAIESDLDRLFAGLWQVKNLNYKIVANEILVNLDLEVFHPVAKVWLTRAGVGACMIRQRSGAQISDINAKLKNALVMDLPHAKAEAIKNAAKSLGAIFGRNLARKASDTTDYKPVLLDKLKALKNANNK
tara:strand:- start:4418 stop:4963 length:546 start_codon:yes stop_codon:yes gene_type:complete